MRSKKSLAILLKDFRLKKSADSLFQRYSEPYFVSFTLVGGEQDQEDIFPAAPMIYPQVRAGDRITFAGSGHFLAPPKVPVNGFVYFSILFMESDSDTRKIGDVMKRVTSKIWEYSEDAIKSNPNLFVGANIGRGILDALAIGFSENSDDMLLRWSGTFLQSSAPSFQLGEDLRHGNDWIDCGISVREVSQEEYEESNAISTYRNADRLDDGSRWGGDKIDRLVQKMAWLE